MGYGRASTRRWGRAGIVLAAALLIPLAGAAAGPGPSLFTPPAAPTGLAATASDRQVALDWNDNSEPDLAGYNVYRAYASGGPYTKINSSLITTSAYTDTPLLNGRTYYFVVRAVNTGSEESGNSAEVSGMPNGETPPAPPVITSETRKTRDTTPVTRGTAEPLLP